MRDQRPSLPDQCDDGDMAYRSSFLVMDIETIIDPRIPLPSKSDQSALPPPPFHQVVAIGALLIDANYRPVRLGIVGEHKSEREALEGFAKFMGDRRSDLVTYNGRGFDLPVIVARCLRHGVTFPYYYRERDVRYRFSPRGHLDLMDFMTDFGAARAVPLDTYTKLIGLPGKVGVDGKDVGPMVHAGRIEEVYNYCLCDVVQTTGLFLRVQLLRGELDRERYIEAMKGLIELMSSDDRVAPVYEGIDRAALLLEESPSDSEIDT